MSVIHSRWSIDANFCKCHQQQELNEDLKHNDQGTKGLVLDTEGPYHANYTVGVCGNVVSSISGVWAE